MSKATRSPEVSVVIPAYNAIAYLGETVKSVIGQSFSAWELIIVDDGSTDSTLDVANELATLDDRISVFSGPNRGVAGARNEGFRQSCPTSAFVVFLDQDDLLEPRALETLLEAQRAQPGALLTYGDVRYIDGAGSLLPDERRNQIPERMTLNGRGVVPESDDASLTFETLIVGNLIQTPGVAIIPRETFEKVGCFDIRLAGTDDLHFWFRASLLGSLRHHAEVVLAYRVHPGAVSRNHQRMIDQTERAFKILLSETALTDEQRDRVEYIYTIRIGIGAARVDQWRTAERLLLDAMKGRSASPETDIEGLNAPLLALLGGDKGLWDRLFAGPPSTLSGEDRKRLESTRRTIESRLAWIHSRLAARAARKKDVTEFASELGQMLVAWAKSMG